MIKRLNQSGQTLIALLIFMMIAMTVTLAATAVAIINIQSTNSFASGDAALNNAESGVEEALVQLERNPSYPGGSLAIDNGSATITVSGSGPLTIVSVGASGSFRRTVTATATYTANVLTLTNWSETP
jgi:hypothetical protein